jgi:acetyltransferase-like isoleucine patch superfamily enzyme
LNVRKITPPQILTFVAILGADLAVGTAAASGLVQALAPGWLGQAGHVVLAVVLSYACTIAGYRLFMLRWPLRSGEIENGSAQEFVYHVHVLHFLILFYPLLRSGVVPIPLMRVLWLALGARLGSNTYGAGIVHDPLFVTIGADCVIGQSALLIPHVIEGSRLAHYPITVGDRVTIGALCAILSDVEIGDDAIIATGAVLTKGTRVGAGETWGGVPARRLRPASNPRATNAVPREVRALPPRRRLPRRAPEARIR